LGRPIAKNIYLRRDHMKGVFNKILRINLKAKTFQEGPTPGSVYESFLGGKGLGMYLLARKNLRGMEPLSPDNKLIFCTGPITNTRIYGSFFLILLAPRRYSPAPLLDILGANLKDCFTEFYMIIFFGKISSFNQSDGICN